MFDWIPWSHHQYHLVTLLWLVSLWSLLGSICLGGRWGQEESLEYSLILLCSRKRYSYAQDNLSHSAQNHLCLCKHSPEPCESSTYLLVRHWWCNKVLLAVHLSSFCFKRICSYVGWINLERLYSIL